MTRDRHLVVAYNFPPFSDASAITQAKRIAESGQAVDVVSQDLTGLRSRDEDLYGLVAPYLEHHHVVPGRPRFVAWNSMREFAVRGLRRLTIREPLNGYTTVYSRSMWPHSHVLAGLVKIHHPEIHWTAEFSDPVLRTIDGSHRPSPALPLSDLLMKQLVRALPRYAQDTIIAGGEMLHLIQALPCALADEVVFTNDQQRTVMLDDLHSEGFAEATHRRSKISPHPAPQAHWVGGGEPRSLETSGICRIGYFGTLYPNRGLGTVTEAVRLLPPDVRRRLRIDVHTAQRSTSHEQVQRNGVGDVIRLKPELPYTDFLTKAGTYDHLLVTDTQTGGFSVANPFLPSKVSDYAAITTNILALVAPGSELSKRGYAPSAPIHDVVAIRDALSQAVRATSSALPASTP